MRLGYARQYARSCIIVDKFDDANSVIEKCEMEGAVYYEGPSENDKAFVVQLPGRPKELYSEQALRKSISCNKSKGYG